jgi:iron-sulfur cluster insertion protein
LQIEVHRPQPEINMNAPTDLPLPIVLSASAAKRVRALIAEEGTADLKLRVFVSGGGCSGFQYGFAFESESNEDDAVVAQDGFDVLVDSTSYGYLVGADIDYIEDLEGARFVIQNPNAATSCGCGSSFSV